VDAEERQETVRLLLDELGGFFSWVIQELGVEYYVEDPARSAESLEESARDVFARRIQARRMHIWERDWHAFSHQPEHPSVYKLLEAQDLEIVHYLEDLPCEHFRVLEAEGGAPSGMGGQVEKRYDQSFGVLLASQGYGWMYRLDFCHVCGLVEIWSMAYNPEEIAWVGGDP